MTDPFDWLNGVGFFDIDLGLDRMRSLLARLGNPEKDLRFIHTAGSNGKGSVCTLTENALRASGYKTGFYSSPHLIHLAERFRINGKIVGNGPLLTAAETVRVPVEAMRKEKKAPTYFEITTAIALVLFRNEKVDFAVWETGLGGRLDATNVVIPEISVITGISLEHTDYLGHTLAAIAGEKAGIIKKGVPVVAGPMPEEALAVIRKRALENSSEIRCVQSYQGKYTLSLNPDNTFFQEITLGSDTIRLPLPGAYQRNNASVAAEVVKLLAGKYGFSAANALKAFENAVWPARMQFIKGKRLLVDGAHNPEGAEALARSLKELFPGRRFHFIAGCFADKDSSRVMESFVPLALDFSLIAFDGSGRKVTSPGMLGKEIADLSGNTVPWKQSTLEDALGLAPSPDGEWTILSGSLHLCGEALELLGEPGF